MPHEKMDLINSCLRRCGTTRSVHERSSIHDLLKPKNKFIKYLIIMILMLKERGEILILHHDYEDNLMAIPDFPYLNTLSSQ